MVQSLGLPLAVDRHRVQFIEGRRDEQITEIQLLVAPAQGLSPAAPLRRVQADVEGVGDGAEHVAAVAQVGRHAAAVVARLAGAAGAGQGRRQEDGERLPVVQELFRNIFDVVGQLHDLFWGPSQVDVELQRLFLRLRRRVRREVEPRHVRGFRCVRGGPGPRTGRGRARAGRAGAARGRRGGAEGGRRQERGITARCQAHAVLLPDSTALPCRRRAACRSS